jgi:hypothetical protein
LGAVGSKKIGDDAADANVVVDRTTARWRRATTDLDDGGGADDPASALAMAMAMDDDARGVILLLLSPFTPFLPILDLLYREEQDR